MTRTFVAWKQLFSSKFKPFQPFLTSRKTLFSPRARDGKLGGGPIWGEGDRKIVLPLEEEEPRLG